MEHETIIARISRSLIGVYSINASWTRKAVWDILSWIYTKKREGKLEEDPSIACAHYVPHVEERGVCTVNGGKILTVKTVFHRLHRMSSSDWKHWLAASNFDTVEQMLNYMKP